MSQIQEVFLESNWEDAAQARAARDQRAAELESQGLTCTCSLLYRITDGCRVYLVEAHDPQEEEASRKPSKPKRSSSRPRSKERETHKVEYR